MSRVGKDRQAPRAVVHKNILDVAESKPEATLAEIAAEVGGATVGLTERVLEEYGDPAATGTAATTDGVMIETDETSATENRDDEETAATEAPADEEPSPGEDYELSDRQTEILRLVLERPHASQGDLAADLDVSRVTVSRQLNDIPGFEWKRRGEQARRLLPDLEGSSAGSEGGELAQLRAQVERLESQVERLKTGPPEDAGGDDPGPVLPPELLHKVVHACMESETFSPEEEMALLRRLL